MQRVTGVTSAAAVHPPRLHLVGFGVGREDSRLQLRPVQLACSATSYLCFQQINWIGPNYCAVWPNHVRLVANHMAFWFHTWLSEYEMAEPAEDDTVSLELANSTRRTHGRNWGPHHRLETPIQSPYCGTSQKNDGTPVMCYSENFFTPHQIAREERFGTVRKNDEENISPHECMCPGNRQIRACKRH